MIFMIKRLFVFIFILVWVMCCLFFALIGIGEMFGVISKLGFFVNILIATPLVFFSCHFIFTNKWMNNGKHK